MSPSATKKTVPEFSPRVKELLDLEEQYSAGGIFPLPAFIKSGQGSTLKDVDGREILDFVCMMSATNLGQSQPVVVEAMQRAVQEITLANIATKVAEWPEFCKEMCQRFGYDKMVGMVSGTEGADSAIKFVRKWGIKVKGIRPAEVLVLGVSDNYHGVASGVWPIMNDMGQASDYGITNENLRNTHPDTGKLLRYGSVQDFEGVLDAHHGRIAAVIMECIHGKKPKFEEELSFAIGVRKLCKKYNILFVADEVRMGCGKTGKFFCSDWMGPENKPDIVVMGKSITAGAYPASYIMGKAEVMDLIGGYEAVATFGMAPQAIAATRAALSVMNSEKLVERAHWIDAVWKEETKSWNYPWVEYITNRGADMGIFLNETEDGRITGRKFGMLCYHKGLLCYPDGNRIRLGVALNITEREFRKGLAILKEALEEVGEYDEINTGPLMRGIRPSM
ncbi:pyridoxal phosphate-dependent transferase [Fusarium solani]|uniref:Ornithine aminotransferase n=1 Tax=Fusarium solani TaxID=169388 RepID=A0A9P9KT01_FUSSL|nr:pyridoxal phosphate-dependent transferase [Fusarium solani]KAH7268003.1 pyridoxal phosphate-dependent transferase [Fusarium solani]